MKICRRKKSYPYWAKYKTIDIMGNVWVFEELPVSARSGLWGSLVNTRKRLIKTKKDYKGDWSQSLRQIEN